MRCGDYFTGRSETTKTKMAINGVYLDHDHDHDRKISVPLVPKVWNERTKLLLFKAKSCETLAYRDANLAFICAW